MSAPWEMNMQLWLWVTSYYLLCSLFIKWCQIPADQMKYETRDLLLGSGQAGYKVTINPRILIQSVTTPAYQDDPRCELTLDVETVTTQ